MPAAYIPGQNPVPAVFIDMGDRTVLTQMVILGVNQSWLITGNKRTGINIPALLDSDILGMDVECGGHR